ncbi:Germin-like protein 5-1 [Triticum urartu]|uniref:Germin-like protein n=1 Tax=Triticum urartu TaxID=4572 RepID=M8AEX3_TRIUA|nr:germin-like protein 5-1 [Triticum urartu]XP_048544094.1 germin-like protein 5-1 [Triticum urartu]EMS59189.1 Germin-like protein 5-1 [Triticum urartu]
MAAAALLLVAALVALGSGHGGEAFDPNPLQDFCVADSTSKVRVNGLSCKDPAAVVSDNFFFAGADKLHDTTSERYGYSALTVQIPGLNTQGQRYARIDLAPGAIFPPHYHPRAAETALVLEGSVYFGFVSSYPDNKLFAKVLSKGDVFAVPQGLMHFLYNNGTAPTALYASLTSQDPGLVLLADALFAGTLPDDLLAKTLLTDKHTVDNIRANFRPS